jgi:putative methionine-R-sulfoxide reductase with GAF domain
VSLEDFVIYLYDPQANVLTQKAALGPKQGKNYKVRNPLMIKPGQGIVGSVAQSKKAEIVSDTKTDTRYIKDDEFRRSELSVPIQTGDTFFGVIDSEHSAKDFYGEKHLNFFSAVAMYTATQLALLNAKQLLNEQNLYISSLEKKLSEKKQFQKIVLPTNEGYHFLHIDDILYCKADNSYTIFYCTDGKKIIVSKNIGEYETLLRNNHFFRIHHSLLINLAHVQKVCKKDGGRIFMSNSQSLPLAQRKKEKFYAIIKQFL